MASFMPETQTAFAREVIEIEDQQIEMPDGCRLSARIWMPRDAVENPVPVILEHLPYRKRDGTIVRDSLTHPWMAGQGYACIRVDMRGNGDSDLKSQLAPNPGGMKTSGRPPRHGQPRPTSKPVS